MTMIAVRLVKTGRPLELHEIAVPEPGSGDVLVRVKAAGICRSDVHYRTGTSPAESLPLTLGHEVAGIIEKKGAGVSGFETGDHVCLHYMVTCGSCGFCHSGNEQFCTSGKMIGKYCDGGYAEFIRVPARSVFLLPSDIPFEQGAVMMCSSATSLHAINKAGLKPGETAAVFGVGGLGISAVQLAKVYGALDVFAVDINPAKLELAVRFGALPVHAGQTDPVTEIMRLTGGRGVDVSLELIGLPLTMLQAVESLAVGGRAALAGITDRSFELTPYNTLLNKEASIIGVSDHLAQEIPLLIDFVERGLLDFSGVITRTVPLDAGEINSVFDEMEQFGNDVRVVITP